MSQPSTGGPRSVPYSAIVKQAFDFQPPGARVADGHIAVSPSTTYSDSAGFGFTVRPAGATNSDGTSFYNNSLPLTEAVPSAVLSPATQDAVVSPAPFVFRTKVAPGEYDVTLWLGDVGTPTHQVRATVNGVHADVERMDINRFRGSFWSKQTKNGPIFIEVGNAVPVNVRVSAPSGLIDVRVEMTPGGDSPIVWQYQADECPVPETAGEVKTDTLVPAFTQSGLQAITLHTAKSPPLALQGDDLVVVSGPSDGNLAAALAAYNAGDLDQAIALADAITARPLSVAKAHLLFWIAGHPAHTGGEADLLASAELLLERWLSIRPHDVAADDLLLQVRLAANAEHYRAVLGYAAYPGAAVDNLGRSCSLVENLPDDHPYARKGQILYLRNRAGLDPRRCTASWERAQWMAQQLDPQYGAVNGHVHLYATDKWTNDGKDWPIHNDWATIAGPGPDWARSLMASLNTHIDLFEWWVIHRQSEEGDIGGGWTDDVEIIPAFGLVAFVLDQMSPLLNEGTLKFVDALWESPTMDQDAAYQAQYADVEHTAEPSGNSFQLYPMLAYGDPEGMERIIKTARTHETLFMQETADGHRHFKANHMSATSIGNSAQHRFDIPLNGRAFSPVSWLTWYSDHPGAESMLTDYMTAWAEDAASTANRKPAGAFPSAVHSESSPHSAAHIGLPNGSWWASSVPHGVYNGLPGYQHYTYGMMGLQFLRSDDPLFRQPFDDAMALTASWVASGSQVPDPFPKDPPLGGEDAWVGYKIRNVSANAMFDVARVAKISDWDEHIRSYGSQYGRWMFGDVTDSSTFAAALYAVNDAVVERWPYRTSEGVMTDRILLPGWMEMIGFYIGANITNVYFGMPVQAVTWQGTGRLFAAAVSKANRDTVEATLYRFADSSRQVAVRVWGLERGARYVLEAGPAPGLGVFTDTVVETTSFVFEERGQAVSFTLPGRTEYALRIRKVAPSTTVPQLRADLAIAPRDVTLSGGTLSVVVHNIGARAAANVDVKIYEGTGPSGNLIAARTIPSLGAPTDLTVPVSDLLKTATIQVPYSPSSLPSPVYVVIDRPQRIAEVTEVNNQVTAYVGGGSPVLPAPMVESMSPATALSGSTLTVTGQNFQDGVVVLDAEATTTEFVATFIDDQRVTVDVGAGVAPGSYLLSLMNPDGKVSNLVAIVVVSSVNKIAATGFSTPSQPGLRSTGAAIGSITCRCVGGSAPTSSGWGLLGLLAVGLARASIRRRR